MLELAWVSESAPTAERANTIVHPIGSRRAELRVEEWGVATLDRMTRYAERGRSFLAQSGIPLDRLQGHEPLTADDVLTRLENGGLAALNQIDGAFVLFWFDSRSEKLYTIRDRFGQEPAFWMKSANNVYVASRASDVVRASGQRADLSTAGLAEYLTFCFVPGNATLFEGVSALQPGGLVCIDTKTGVIKASRWYCLSYRQPLFSNEQDIRENYREMLAQAVSRRVSGDRAGVFLSGGMDSSSVLTFLRKTTENEVKTFGFRCAGESFDESHYARELAAVLGTQHTEIAYGEPDALRISEMVKHMDVPFSDIGIEVSSWLLAGASSGEVDYILTGDGGDELWASHPIYAAQKLLRPYDVMPIPSFLHRGLNALFNLANDSDRKRDLRVVLKRILPIPGLPKSLGPYRWRAYYGPKSLRALTDGARINEHITEQAYRAVLDEYARYDGTDDGLSKFLHCDYTTASRFYFNRLRLARNLGLEIRMPFYDTDLVECGARIPANLKLEGMERTKRLFREAMDGVLPDVINKRQDKLGHSVPFKNWLRGDGQLGRSVRERLKDRGAPGMGLFSASAVESLIAEHGRGRHNHSHRLWGIYTLSLWLEANGELISLPR